MDAPSNQASQKPHTFSTIRNTKDKITLTSQWPHSLINVFHLLLTRVVSWYYSQKFLSQPCKGKTSELPLGNHYLGDQLRLLHSSFSSCCCCYRNQSAARRLKCEGLMFFPIHLLEALKSFCTVSCLGPSFSLCLKMPVGLNCSNAFSYELPALSLIYWICCPIYSIFSRR